jgi:hypothetical protein
MHWVFVGRRHVRSRLVPVREVRFKSDGGVHDLFTITGLPGTPSSCQIFQPNFSKHLQQFDVSFSYPDAWVSESGSSFCMMGERQSC